MRPSTILGWAFSYRGDFSQASGERGKFGCGPTDRFRRVWVKLELADGKFVSGTFRPHAGDEAGWSGRIAAAELKMTGRKVAGRVTAELRSRSVAAGTYTFSLDAETVGNSVFGRASSALNGKALARPTGTFTGTLSSTARPASHADAAIELTVAGGVEGSSDLHVHLDRRGGKFTTDASSKQGQEN